MHVPNCFSKVDLSAKSVRNLYVQSIWSLSMFDFAVAPRRRRRSSRPPRRVRTTPRRKRRVRLINFNNINLLILLSITIRGGVQPGAGDIAGQGDDGGADEERGDHQGNGLQAAGKEGAQVSLVFS